MEKKNQEQNKFSVSFKNNKVEQDLKKWLLNKSELIGVGAYIKQVLGEKKAIEEATK